MQKQMTVMLFDDVTDVLLMYIGSGHKRKCIQDPGVSSVQSVSLSVFSLGSLACSPVRLSRKSQIL